MKKVFSAVVIICWSLLVSVEVGAHCEQVRAAVSTVIKKSFSNGSIPRLIDEAVSVKPSELNTALANIGVNAGLNAGSQEALMVLGHLHYSSQKLAANRYEDSLAAANQCLTLLSKSSQIEIARVSRAELVAQAEYIRDISIWQRIGSQFVRGNNPIAREDILTAFDILSRQNAAVNESSSFYVGSSFSGIEQFFVSIADDAVFGVYGPVVQRLFRTRWNDQSFSYLVLGDNEVVEASSDALLIRYIDGGGGSPPSDVGGGGAVWGEDPERIFGFPLSKNDTNEPEKNIAYKSLYFDAEIVNPKKLNSLHRKFVQKFMDHESNALMELFDVEKTEVGMNLVIGERRAKALGISGVIPVSADEFSVLQQGTSPKSNRDLIKLLASAENEKSLVAFSSPLDLQSSDNFSFQTEVSFALQKAFPNARIIRDRYTRKTRNNVEALGQAKLGAGEQYLALVAKKSFEVSRQKAITNTSEFLEDAGVRVEDVGLGDAVPKDAREKVIVITGHSDAKLAEYVDYLGVSGSFKNKVVILNSCNIAPTPAMVEKITGSYGAKGVLMHEGIIHTSALTNFYKEFSEKLRSEAEGNLVTTVKSLMQKVGLNAIWSICWSWVAEASIHG